MRQPKSVYACFLPRNFCRTGNNPVPKLVCQPHRYRESDRMTIAPLAGAGCGYCCTANATFCLSGTPATSFPRRPMQASRDEWPGWWPRPSRRPLRGLLRVRVRERDAPDAVVVPRHRVSPSASPMTGSSGASSTPRLSVQSRLPLEYWIRLRSLSYGGQVIRPTAYVSAISRRDAPEFCRTVVPPGMRGRREDRVHAAPAVSCANCT
jgi:hypothetical protein